MAENVTPQFDTKYRPPLYFKNPVKAWENHIELMRAEGRLPKKK